MGKCARMAHMYCMFFFIFAFLYGGKARCVPGSQSLSLTSRSLPGQPHTFYFPRSTLSLCTPSRERARSGYRGNRDARPGNGGGVESGHRGGGVQVPGSGEEPEHQVTCVFSRVHVFFF